MRISAQGVVLRFSVRVCDDKKIIMKLKIEMADIKSDDSMSEDEVDDNTSGTTVSPPPNGANQSLRSVSLSCCNYLTGPLLSAVVSVLVTHAFHYVNKVEYFVSRVEYLS